VTHAPGGPQQVQAAFAQVLDAFAELFEWTYQVAITAPQRQALDAEVVGSWSHPDQSVRQLVTYVLGLHSIVFGAPAGARDVHRADAQRQLRRAFGRLEGNARGRVLGLLHQVLEQLRPACTGTAPAAVPTAVATFAPPLPSPVAAPAPAIPGWPPPAAPYPAPAAPMADVPQFQQRIQDAQVRQQQILLENQIWNMQHDTIMKILR
jgi:hypothetical protein